jgi:hypothetical protein
MFAARWENMRMHPTISARRAAEAETQYALQIAVHWVLYMERKEENRTAEAPGRRRTSARYI